ncbi:60S ribosomal protein L31-like [Ochotona curzoniae]|uniref:60S ribosomal protein L31-like n=1 Tax=Ochotona curzoniae TaxID=130825 RepID=UPI001B3535C6|nr:60S ribosomal protein L31-like [Ochotona curzoniae]
MTPTKKSGKKKDCSTISKVVIQDPTINFHKSICRVSFKRSALRHAKRSGACREGDGDTRLNKATWVKEIRNIPYCICMRLSRKHNKDEDSPDNSTFWLPMYLSYFKLEPVNVDKN